jgi:hypothetical protein
MQRVESGIAKRFGLFVPCSYSQAACGHLTRVTPFAVDSQPAADPFFDLHDRPFGPAFWPEQL